MRKIDEIKDRTSCLNMSRDDEMIFVLTGRDRAAPEAIRAWCARRILLGVNVLSDSKIQEALRAAEVMERER